MFIAFYTYLGYLFRVLHAFWPVPTVLVGIAVNIVKFRYSKVVGGDILFWK